MKQNQFKITSGFVASLANDISEDIDNKESRETLRACIAYLWDDRIKREIQGNAAKRMQQTIEVTKMVLGILEADANVIATTPGAEEYRKQAEAAQPETGPEQ